MRPSRAHRFDALEDIKDGGVEEYWRGLRDGLNEVSGKVLGVERSRRKEWISQDSWAKVGERRELKRRLEGADADKKRRIQN